MGSFPSHLVSRHLPVSFETFLLMTPSSLFLSCPIPQTSSSRARPSAETSVPGAAWQLHGSVKERSLTWSGAVSLLMLRKQGCLMRTRLTLVCFPLVSLTFDKVTSLLHVELCPKCSFLPFSTVRLILKIMKFYATFVLSYRWKPKVFLPNCQEFYRP